MEDLKICEIWRDKKSSSEYFYDRNIEKCTIELMHNDTELISDINYYKCNNLKISLNEYEI